MFKGREWTQDELEELIEGVKMGISLKVISENLGIPWRIVQSKSYQLMLKPRETKREEWKLFFENFPGMKLEWYAKRMKVSKATVCRRLQACRTMSLANVQEKENRLVVGC